jgi:hypothetical protein
MATYGLIALKIVEICNALVGLCFLCVLEGLALKLGFHTAAIIAHLSPGTRILVISQIPICGTRDVGRESTNAIHFRPMLYTCIMDKMNDFYLVLLQE